MRAKANPDPMVGTHTRARDGKVFKIHAFRSGDWTVYLEGNIAKEIALEAKISNPEVVAALVTALALNLQTMRMK